MLAKAVKYAKSLIKNERFYDFQNRNKQLKKVLAEIDNFRRTGKYPDKRSKSPKNQNKRIAKPALQKVGDFLIVQDAPTFKVLIEEV